MVALKAPARYADSWAMARPLFIVIGTALDVLRTGPLSDSFVPAAFAGAGEPSDELGSR